MLNILGEETRASGSLRMEYFGTDKPIFLRINGMIFAFAYMIQKNLKWYIDSPGESPLLYHVQSHAASPLPSKRLVFDLLSEEYTTK